MVVVELAAILYMYDHVCELLSTLPWAPYGIL